MNRIERVNDFVIRFANVNGSGSASANNLFAQAIFRMGIPVSPKNIFPSNIQGLPTWYEVRVNEKGYLGRRGGYDMVVAVNGQTLLKDYNEVASGGYFFYDSTRVLPDECQRTDITVLGMPLTELCNEAFENPKLRQLLKNIIYVGALSHLLDIEFSVLTDSIQRQFKKKPKLAEPNIQALEIGLNYAREHFTDSCRLSVVRRDLLTDAIIMDGNSATGLGALYAGATVAGWYPITPSTSVIEAFERFAGRYRIEDETGRRKVAIIQAEDELAALGMVIGAAWNGARSFTATSGPGISLMSEFLGLAYFSEVPVVLIDVQRTGPSTGMPTRTQQSDLIAAAYASHGDTRNVLLFPCDPAECFELTAQAFDLAERLQTPVLVMTDLDLGMNDHVSRPLVWDDKRRYDRGKVLSAEQLDALETRWGRYLDIDGDGICYRTIPGTHPTQGAYFTRGTSHDEYAAYTEDSGAYERNMIRLLTKWDTAKTMVPEPHITIRDPQSKVGAIFFGTTTHSAYEAINRLEEEGTAINTMRLLSFPLTATALDFINSHDMIFVIEQNRDSQLKTLIVTDNGILPNKLVPLTNFDGMPITADYITEKLEAGLAVSTTTTGGSK
ncbi:2-oxoacid:acceptor oxidoreductase subunit alpha [Desulfopila aestuarii]|uniref:2-oxoglutarate ferredoxin oxidoreductase subunit alpha n=1 Tax=Desulfopila aestuarii DSM 18488 TaxID=1121416 RepID=A0A1M7Y788_9BACT|nr:2-oxoacid:acceptor oxidoreductase subunit alpha [Desulfopila aestuarii]SHO48489.1 2-oxoglutarate ferredoxin oxidoreductase subunit alpha [Desulfopila aestuarii DSM 18488]